MLIKHGENVLRIMIHYYKFNTIVAMFMILK